MPQSEYRARQVGAKTNEVLNYHRDDSSPGKPLYILIPGGLVALAALGVIIFIAYLTWFEGRLAQKARFELVGKRVEYSWPRGIVTKHRILVGEAVKRDAG